MIKKKNIFNVILAGVVALSTATVTLPINQVVAKSSTRSTRSVSRPSSKPSNTNKSSKPSSSTSSSKPSSSSTSSKNSSSKSTSSESTASSSTKNFKKSNAGSYNANYNSFNNSGYKNKYQSYLRNNYQNNGFFSGSTVTNMLLWYTLFNLGTNHGHAKAQVEQQATDTQKELANNIKESNTPVYMLEIKTASGDIKYVTVTKEQYEKVTEGNNISLKNGQLEIK